MNLGSLVGYLGLDTADFDKGLSGAESSLGSFARSAAVKAAAAGAVIATALGGAIAGSMNIDAANDKLAAQIGLSAPESERIGGIAGQLYANAYGDSLEGVNGAVAAVIGSIGGMRDATSADLQAVTANALDFATAMDVDVASAATSAGILLKTGLATNATGAFDLLTVAAQKAGPAMVQPVMEAANEYATNFATMGFSGEQAMGLLVDASSGGEIAIDKVGDSIKEFSIRATDMSKTSVAAYDTLGLSADEMANKILAGGTSAQEATQQIVGGLLDIEDPATRANTAIALFGTPIEDLNVTEIPAFLQSLQSASGGLGEVAGAAGRMGTALNDNASTNLESFKRQVTQTFVDVVGGQVLPQVGEFASAMATQFGPAVSAASSFLTGTLVPALQSAAQWISQNQTPITIVAGLITAVFLPAWIALGVTATVNAAKTVAAFVATQAGAIAAAAVHSAQVVRMVAGWVLMGAQAVAQGVVMAAVWTGQVVAAAAAGAAAFVASAARVVAGWVLMGAQSLIQAARMAAAWVIAMGPVGWVIAAVVGLVALIIANWDTVVRWTKTAWSAVTSFISDAWKNITGKVTGGAAAVWGAIQSAWNSVKSATSSAWNAVKSTVSTAISNVVSFVSGLPGRSVSALSSLGSLITGVASRAWASFSSAVSSGISNAISFIAALPGRAVSALGNVGSLLTSAGADLIRGFVSGIKNMAGNVASAAMDAAKGAVNSVKSFLGINSPSRVFAGLGENVGEGFVNGIAGMQPAVAAQMAALADTQALESLSVPTFTASASASPSYQAARAATPAATAPAQSVTRIEVDARGLGADAIARAIERRQQQRDALASRRG